MDDLDLERLKQELDDVSGGSRYDVDDIMREEGASEPEPDRESLEQLMQRFGIHVEQSGADAAPAGEQPKPSQTEEYAALLRASEQMQDVIDQQNELAEQARGETPQPDPLEEQEDVFARLFNQLGEIEQDPVDAVFAAPQADITDPRTELLEEPEEEPDLMARLFADAPVPVQPARAQDDAQATVRWDALYDADATQVMPPVGIEDEAGQPDELPDGDETQLIPPVETDGEPEMPDSAPDEAADDTPEQPAPEAPRKGFWTKWFGADEDDSEEIEESEDAAGDELPDGDETQLIPPVETDGEPETVDEVPDEAADDTLEEPAPETPRKGFWTKWFGADEDDSEEIEESENTAEDEQPDGDETQLIPPVEIDDEPETVDEAPEEPAEDTPEQPAPEAPRKGFWTKWFGADEDEAEESEDTAGDELPDGDETQLIPPVETNGEPETVDEAPDEAAEDTPEQPAPETPRKGFWTKWFGADEDEESEDTAEDELPDADAAQGMPPVEIDGEPETVDEVPDEAADDTPEQPAPETPRKGFWTKWFGADEDEAEESEDTAEDELSDADETQLIPPVETDGEPETVDEVPDEAAEDTPEQPAPEAPRKGFWTKWFGADEDDGGEAEESEDTAEDEPSDADAAQGMPPVETDDKPETPDEAPEEETGDAPQEIYYEPEVEERLPEPPQDDAGEADEPSAGVAEPAPRPEDIPVISEEELEEFLSGVEEEPEEPIASFEQLLQDNGMQAEPPVPGQPNRLPEEFPEEETTVYLNLPVNKPGAPQAQEPELFDAEADLEAEAQQEKEEKRKNLAKEPDPAWFRQTLEELSQTAPALEELRREGPVMQREVARQREWILERHRAYMQAQHPAPPQEQPPEPEEPEEDSEPDAIEAAEELRALLEQDRREDDAVFNDRPDGKPEAEPDGREQMIDTPQADRQPDDAPADDRSGEQPEQDASPAAQPETPAAPRKAKRPPRARREEEIPRDLHKAANLWKQRARGQAQRSMIVAVLTAVALYLSCAADFALPLPASMDYVNRPDGVLTALLVLQLAAMAAAFDVVRDGVRAVMQRSPDLSTLVDLALVLNLAHCAALLVREGEELPYAGVAMLALFARMRAQVSDARTRHYVYKVAAGVGAPAGVFCRADGTIVKAPLDGAEPFVRQIVKPDRGRQAEAIVTALAAVLSLVLSVLVCVATGDAGRIAYVLAATMTGACQLALLSAIPMGRCNAARHLMKSGAALDGVRGASALAAAGAVVVTDDDLFPAGSVALERLELRSQLNDATALAYAAALAGESSLGHMLAEEVRARYGTPLTAHHVVRYTGGGISGRIGGLEILLGGADFMAERGIPVSDVPESGLVLAVEHEVAAVLVVDYQVPAVLFNAMQVLTERRTRILLHTRNHQVTPELVERLYGLREGTVQLPELETDRALRNPRYAAEGALCAMLLRDSLVPFADTISTAQAQSRLTRAGALIGVGAALLCMLLMAYLCFVFVPEDARPIRMLLYMILCFVPIFFLESGVGRD